MFRKCVFALLLLAATGSIQSAQPADTLESRVLAANRLFDVPAFRQIATRQIYESVKFLPEEQYRRATDALSKPDVVESLKAVIVRSLAQTFTVTEIEFLHRWLSSTEMRSLVGKIGGFEANFTRELLTAAVTNPALGEIMLGK